MKNGYDKFFKDAQRAAGLTQGKQSPSPKAKVTAKPQSGASDRFNLNGERRMTPEQMMRRALAEKIEKRKKLARSRRAKFPVMPVVFTGVAIVACAAAYHHGDLLDSWLGRIEVGVFGQAEAANDVKKQNEPAEAAKSSKPTGSEMEKPAETKVAETSAAVPNIKQWTPEELSFFSKLNERKKELDHREADLHKLEEELQKRKAELDEKIKQLESMRAEISKQLETRVAADQAKVDKLVQFYSSMKPSQAAKVIETLNEDLAVEVLDKMKKKSAAEILDMMSAKKARRLSELLTGYQRSVASGGEAQTNEDTTAKDN